MKPKTMSVHGGLTFRLSPSSQPNRMKLTVSRKSLAFFSVDLPLGDITDLSEFFGESSNAEFWNQERFEES